MTRYALDLSTRVVAGGSSPVVLGGSPLRMFRLTATGGAAFDRVRAGDDVPDSRLVQRLLDSGAIHPVADTTAAHAFSVDDVTVVVPALVPSTAALDAIVEACAGAAAVVIVDDASTPPVGDRPGAAVVRRDRNGGPGAARMTGLGQVATRLVAFVDTDVEPPLGWLAGLLCHFDDPRVALVAPRVASGAALPGASERVARYERRRSPLDLGQQPARIAPGTRVSYVAAAAIVVRTDALAAIGGFDPSMRWGEDVDMVWRLVGAGWRARYEPAVTVTHTPRHSWASLARQRATYGSSAAALGRRHGAKVAPVRTSAWSLAVWALAVAGRPSVALATAAGTAAALVRKLRGVPAVESVRLVATGHAYAGLALADAVRRCWLPVALALVPVSRRARCVALAAVLPALWDGGPARLLDDAAYAAGVWRGVLRERTITPLVPQLVSWPGHQASRAAPDPAGADDTFAP